MLTASLKINKPIAVSIVCMVLTAGIFAVSLIMFGNTVPETAKIEGLGRYSLKVSGEEETRAFFRRFGLEIDFESCAQREIVLPKEFDSLYDEYNSLQKAQGLDLYPYRGEKALQKIYPIEGQKTEMYAVLIVMDNKVIGGHINIGGKDTLLRSFTGDTADELKQ